MIVRLLLLALLLVGSGLPARAETTVVFIAGLGDGPESFGRIARKLKGVAPVYRDDRSGAAATGAEVADQLAARLAGNGHSPPYLLVGHSLGGLYALAYARRYPDQVAGVVLVDARLPDFPANCREAKVGNCDVPELMKALMPIAQKRELAAEAAVADYARPALSGLPVPLTVIAADQPGLGLDASWQAVWIKTARQAAADAGARFVLAKGAGHYIHKDAPDLVRTEILRLLGK